jgi:hypothetical protein
VFVAPLDSGFSVLPDPTDGRGRASLRYAGRTPRMPVWLAVMQAGVVEPLRLVELDSSGTQQLTLVARGEQQDTTELERLLEMGATTQGLRMLMEQKQREQKQKQPPGGRPQRRGRLVRRDAFDVICGRSLVMFSSMDCNACHAPSKTAVYAALQWALDLRPRTGSSSPFADLRLKPPPADELRKRQRELHVPTPTDWGPRLEKQYGPARTAFVWGMVTTADGRPAIGVPVAWLQDGELRMRVSTDADGRYDLRLPVGVSCTLTCAGGSKGSATVNTVAAFNGLVRADLHLDLPLPLRGLALDDRGDPLVGWRVEFDDGGPANGLATTGEDGSFEFAGPERPGRLLLWPTDQDLRLPVLRSDLVLPGALPVQLRLSPQAPPRSRLRVRPVLPAGHEHARVELRLLQIDTGRGAFFVRTGNDEAFDLEGLASGPYRVEIGAQGLGWMSVGPVWLDGHGLQPLGALMFPVPGSVHLLVADGVKSPLQVQHTIWRRGEHTDVAVEVLATDAVHFQVPPGDYALAWRDLGVPRAVAFSVRSADETAVAIDSIPRR